MDESQAIKVLDALAQTARLRAFRLVADADERGLSNSDIAEALGLTKSTVSRHLAALVDAGLLKADRDGRNMLYCAIPVTAEEAMRYVTG